jgi:hypothetical protein
VAHAERFRLEARISGADRQFPRLDVFLRLICVGCSDASGPAVRHPRFPR